MNMNIKWHFTDEHKIATRLMIFNTFTPGEKGENGGFEQPHAQWIVSNQKTKPVQLII